MFSSIVRLEFCFHSWLPVCRCQGDKRSVFDGWGAIVYRVNPWTLTGIGSCSFVLLRCPFGTSSHCHHFPSLHTLPFEERALSLQFWYNFFQYHLWVGGSELLSVPFSRVASYERFIYVLTASSWWHLTGCLSRIELLSFCMSRITSPTNFTSLLPVVREG